MLECFPLSGQKVVPNNKRCQVFCFMGELIIHLLYWKNIHEIQLQCGLDCAEITRMEWRESETLNRHSAGPGGSEGSDELSSRLFVLQRLM